MEQYLPSYLKTQNRKMLFELLRHENALSRTEIASITGMSFPTVIKTVDVLIEKGVIEECHHFTKTSGAGRRSHKLRFCPNGLLAIGVEFEGRYAKVGLVNMSGVVLDKTQLTLGRADSEDELLLLAAAIENLLKRHKTSENERSLVLGAGIGFPANFNPETSDIVSFKQMQIEKETPFKTVFPNLVSRISLPLFVDNDVKLICEGEAFMRAEEMQWDNMVYITLGTGCGAACRINGKLFYGSHFMAGEIGRIGLTGYAADSPAQITCLEDILSLESIKQKFGLQKDELSALDAQTRQKLCAYLAKPLASVLYNIAAAMDINLFVLGGIIPQALGQPFFDEIKTQVSINFCNSLPGAPQIIVLPSSVQDAGIIGAASSVFAKITDSFLENE